MSEVLKKLKHIDLCKELAKASGWKDTKDSWWIMQWGEAELHPTDQRVLHAFIEAPEYTAGYLLEKLRNYDFTIVNLNTTTLSLTSESLDEPDGAILGETFAEVMCRLAIELIKQKIIPVKENIGRPVHLRIPGGYANTSSVPDAGES